jgi:hypothetical protein
MVIRMSGFPTRVDLHLWLGEDGVFRLELFQNGALINTSSWVPVVEIKDLDGVLIHSPISFFESNGLLAIRVPVSVQAVFEKKRYLWQCKCTVSGEVTIPFAGDFIVGSL